MSLPSPAGEPRAFTFDFDTALYRLVAIKKAAYRYSAHFEVRFESVTPDRVRVVLQTRQKTPGWECDPQGFPGEVLDQELREIVAEETKGVRDLLLAQAFSGLALIDPTGENADYRDDPLHIGTARSGAE